MLAVLQRTDTTVFKFGPERQAAKEAARLSEGQSFDIETVAIFKVTHERITAPLHKFLMKNGWYEAQLPHILNAWIDARETEEYGSPLELEDVSAEEPEESQADEPVRKTFSKAVPKDPVQEQTLPEWLVYCNAAEAPLTTEMRGHAIGLLGKEGVKTLNLDSKTYKDKDGKVQRIACWNKKPVSYQ